MAQRQFVPAILASCMSMAALAANPAIAGEIRVQPGAALQLAVDAAEPGDRLILLSGEHAGPVVLDKPLELTGLPETTVLGAGKGTVITVSADDIVVSNLRVRGSGSSHEDLDSGIKVTKRARNARILNNLLEGNLVGIDIHGGIDALVKGNTVIGRRDHRMNSRGNGIYVWNAPGTVISGNDVRYGRDGIFVNTSKDNRFEGNRFRDLRFAVHYMYTHNSELIDNRSSGNHVGYALMYSKNLLIEGNVSLGDRDHGIMLNYVNDAELRENAVIGGRDKCLFMYNAHKNRIRDNRFEGCPIGVHFTAGSERNSLAGNSFVGNRNQVKYVGSRWLEWSEDGQGNYWSDHSAFDLDGDGLADMPYRPNDLVDHILWSQPYARFLLGSPAIQLIRWALDAFPGLLPGGVIDSHPLMRPNDQSALGPEPAT